VKAITHPPYSSNLHTSRLFSCSLKCIPPSKEDDFRKVKDIKTNVTAEIKAAILETFDDCSVQHL
jgi:hypothetical protein